MTFVEEILSRRFEIASEMIFLEAIWELTAWERVALELIVWEKAAWELTVWRKAAGEWTAWG